MAAFATKRGFYSAQNEALKGSITTSNNAFSVYKRKLHEMIDLWSLKPRLSRRHVEKSS